METEEYIKHLENALRMIRDYVRDRDEPHGEAYSSLKFYAEEALKARRSELRHDETIHQRNREVDFLNVGDSLRSRNVGDGQFIPFCPRP